jgi:LPXTG-motif cell wall-anchored protein
MKRISTPARGLRLACSLSLPLALMSVVLADTLKLKDGTTLEGVATDIPPDSIKFEWRPSKSIKEERIFKRSDIAELKRLAPDELEITALRTLLPTPDLFGATGYTKIIEGQLKPFLTKYPASKLAEEVKGILKTCEEELEKVNNGWQKLEGKWISPEESKWNDYNIEARILRKQMQDDIKALDTKGALDKMIKLKSEYIGTPAFVEAVESYSKMLDSYDRELLGKINEYPARKKELEANKATLDKVAAEELQLAIDKRKSDLKLKNDDEKKLKVPILSSDEYDLQSLKASQVSVAKERVAVAALIRDKAKYAEVADLVSRALAEGGKGNSQMAFTLMDQAMKKDVIKNDPKLKAKTLAFKNAADESAKNAPKPVVNTPALPPKGDPAPPKVVDKVKEDKAAAAKKMEEAKQALAAKKAETASLEAEEETGTGTYLLGGAGLLVVAGAAFAFLKKRRKNEDDE